MGQGSPLSRLWTRFSPATDVRELMMIKDTPRPLPKGARPLRVLEPKYINWGFFTS